jgi:formylglycine-generating enzyme required for sulfatase activity
VGTFKANKYGLFDMHGNAWQWCEDYYGKYEDVPKKKDPVQSNKQPNNRRVLRGGSWNLNPTYCRSAVRFLNAPDGRINDFGFRVAVLP